MESALSAIGKLNNTPYKGGTLLVKLAEKSKKAEVAENELCRFFAQGGCMRGNNCNFKHMMPHRQGARPDLSANGARDHNRDRGRAEPIKHLGSSGRLREGGPSHLPPPNKAGPSQRPDNRGFERDRREPERLGGILPSPVDRSGKRAHPADFDEHSKRSRSNDHPPAAFGHMSDRGRPAPPHSGESRRPMLEPPQSSQPKPLFRDPSVAQPRREAPPVDLRPPYDCVIISGSDAQRSYCNVIDKKLSEFGMLTNVQVVAGEHLLKRAVDEASRHTVPYTICVSANNAEHRSLTLNILHGVAQEHRNMPLEDAMPFLSRNFDNFVDMMKKKISAINEWPSPDRKVACFLNLLAEGRRITMGEVLEVDKYIEFVKSKLKATEAAVAKGGRIGGIREELVNNVDARRGLSDHPALRAGELNQSRGLLNKDRMMMDRDLGRERELHERDRGLVVGDQGMGDRDRGLFSRDHELLERERGAGERGRGLLPRDHAATGGGLPDRGRMVAERERGLEGHGGHPHQGRGESFYKNPVESEGYGAGRNGGMQEQIRGRGAPNENRFVSRDGPSFDGNDGSSKAGHIFENPMVKRALDDLLTSRSQHGQQNPGARGLLF